ncbi:MAG: hypothetical protein MJ060_02825 [Clostridia bacterium]|nr:hypothetical protein [Clostridia bacterium]
MDFEEKKTQYPNYVSRRTIIEELFNKQSIKIPNVNHIEFNQDKKTSQPNYIRRAVMTEQLRNNHSVKIPHTDDNEELKEYLEDLGSVLEEINPKNPDDTMGK